MYTPKLEDSLISVRRISKKGYKLIIKGDRMKIFDGGQLVAEAEDDGSLYRLKQKKRTDIVQLSREAVCILEACQLKFGNWSENFSL